MPRCEPRPETQGAEAIISHSPDETRFLSGPLKLDFDRRRHASVRRGTCAFGSIAWPTNSAVYADAGDAQGGGAMVARQPVGKPIKAIRV